MTPKKLERCECCSRQGILKVIPSLMDLTDFRACDTCFDRRAHPLGHIVKVEQQVKWRNLPREVKDSVTVWCDENYIPIIDWARRATEQQVVVYQGLDFPMNKSLRTKEKTPDPVEAAEEADIQRILTKTKQVVDACPMFFQDTRNRRTGVVANLLNFFGVRHG